MDDLQKAMNYVAGLSKRIKTLESGAMPQQPIMYATQQNNQSRINPYYMAPQQDNSLGAMGMYQQYKNTGVLPPDQSSFTPYTPPPVQYVSGAPIQTSGQSVAAKGGK